MVFDMGGGTTDITIFECFGGTEAGFAFRGTAGNRSLGGDDVDGIIVDWFGAGNGAEVRKLCRNAKIEICGIDGEEEGKDLIEIVHNENKKILTRILFDDLIQGIVKKCEDLVDRAVGDLGGVNIDEVILVGGSSRIPAVKEMLKNKVSFFCVVLLSS